MEGRNLGMLTIEGAATDFTWTGISPSCVQAKIPFQWMCVFYVFQCSVTCGKGMQSRVIQCMHKITGRHGNECFSSEKPAAYRPCHLHPCNEKINVNTITSPRLGKQSKWHIPAENLCLVLSLHRVVMISLKTGLGLRRCKLYTETHLSVSVFQCVHQRLYLTMVKGFVIQGKTLGLHGIWTQNIWHENMFSLEKL